MKLHEDAIRYNVKRHGSEFVEVQEEPVVFPCPECFSTNVREGTISNFICEECGCAFNAQIYKKPTKAGERLSLFLKFMIGIFVGIAIILCIGGLVFLAYERNKLGTPLPNKYTAITLAMSIGGPSVCMLIIYLLQHINNTIWEK